MSTIVISNIKATGETASRAVSGVAAAWVNFDGTGTVAVRDSVNVASITDNGTGDCTSNISNSFSNANYCTNVSCGESTTNPSIMASSCVNVNASSVRQEHCYTNIAANADAANCYTSFHGDLA